VNDTFPAESITPLSTGQLSKAILDFRSTDNITRSSEEFFTGFRTVELR